MCVVKGVLHCSTSLCCFSCAMASPPFSFACTLASCCPAQQALRRAGGGGEASGEGANAAQVGTRVKCECPLSMGGEKVAACRCMFHQKRVFPCPSVSYHCSACAVYVADIAASPVAWTTCVPLQRTPCPDRSRPPLAVGFPPPPANTPPVSAPWLQAVAAAPPAPLTVQCCLPTESVGSSMDLVEARCLVMALGGIVHLVCFCLPEGKSMSFMLWFVEYFLISLPVSPCIAFPHSRREEP